MTMKFIPNLLTLSNLFCGCLSIVYLFMGELSNAGLLIFLAAVFDFCDGFAARLLHAYSEIGKELDSLADMVSFGVAPAMIAFRFLQSQPIEHFPHLPYIAFLIALCAAYRLAKFNISTQQSVNFIGMPSPANALFWASLLLCLVNTRYQTIITEQQFRLLLNPAVVTTLVIMMSALMVCNISMFSLKFRNLNFKDNSLRYIIIWICIGFYFGIGVATIPVSILIYVLMSVIFVNRKAVTMNNE
ncbi:CDP-diacylglycerol--serine O-phosphatidyltransferase [Bacteroidia bacterium]|nr:CDP-diacylglycerol--serine O-phosphatidyltransferase [Bacteroidia bacterium]